MTPEFGSAPNFTPAQLENQRLFRVGPSVTLELPGDKAKRVVRKLAIFTAATAADLAESWAAEKILRKIKTKMVNDDLVQQGDPDAVRKGAYFSGIGFVEDMVSDEVYAMGMNAILRGMTGLADASYPSPTARFISHWTNLGSYASGKFAGLEQFWKKPWNIVNAVNAEAAIGLFEELPFGIGKAVAWAHKGVDGLLNKEATKLVNGIVGAAVTGYHIEKNMVNPVRQASAPAQRATAAT
jgi:hypothetical protein